MFKLDNKIGLGLAALGRPGYINIGHGDNLGRDKSKASMRDYCHQVLDFAYSEGVRYSEPKLKIKKVNPVGGSMFSSDPNTGHIKKGGALNSHI